MATTPATTPANGNEALLPAPPTLAQVRLFTQDEVIEYLDCSGIFEGLRPSFRDHFAAQSIKGRHLVMRCYKADFLAPSLGLNVSEDIAELVKGLYAAAAHPLPDAAVLVPLRLSFLSFPFHLRGLLMLRKDLIPNSTAGASLTWEAVPSRLFQLRASGHASPVRIVENLRQQTSLDRNSLSGPLSLRILHQRICLSRCPAVLRSGGGDGLRVAGVAGLVAFEHGGFDVAMNGFLAGVAGVVLAGVMIVR
ncbi:hypothetical protein FN846DRAFT_997517 [Sphaerosporella brunnea]|uniref:Uncharacterized protein n=1 Tax=Sphaerosporella brunnea TaxID=1250544 RepID=A0A5J5EJ38_9PEZI|nr:hypothetical protein FN846DRAFT_997517 [Sphaerosporella brunnea]